MTDELQQSQYINMSKEQGLNAVILKHPIDQPFVSRLEEAKKDMEVKFRRIDTDLADIFKEASSEDEKKTLEEDQTKLADIFKKALGVEELDVKVEKLKNADTSAMITLSEDMRRMQDMMKMYGMSQKVMELLDSLVDRGNTVIVIEHNLDVMKQADWLIDVGPDGGTAGGEIVFSGTPKEMAEHACTITAEYLRKSM